MNTSTHFQIHCSKGVQIESIQGSQTGIKNLFPSWNICWVITKKAGQMHYHVPYDVMTQELHMLILFGSQLTGGDLAFPWKLAIKFGLQQDCENTHCGGPRQPPFCSSSLNSGQPPPLFPSLQRQEEGKSTAMTRVAFSKTQLFLQENHLISTRLFS